MIQSALQGIPSSELKVDATNPSVDVSVVWPHAVRIVKCTSLDLFQQRSADALSVGLVDLALETQDGVTAKNALELSVFPSVSNRQCSYAYDRLRSLNCKAWDGTHLVLRQLDGIGEKSIKVRIVG